LRTLEGLERNSLTPRAQDSSEATYAPKIEKEEARIDWTAPARHLFNLLRAFDPWPGAFTTWKDRKIKLFHPRLAGDEPGKVPGTLIRASADGLLISASEGTLLLREVQMESRPRMPVGEFLRGVPLQAGMRLGA
jgi:methionyl-tRNA formyltransferase